MRALHIAKVQGESSYQDGLSHSLGTHPGAYVGVGGLTQYRLMIGRLEGGESRVHPGDPVSRLTPCFPMQWVPAAAYAPVCYWDWGSFLSGVRLWD